MPRQFQHNENRPKTRVVYVRSDPDGNNDRVMVITETGQSATMTLTAFEETCTLVNGGINAL